MCYQICFNYSLLEIIVLYNRTLFKDNYYLIVIILFK